MQKMKMSKLRVAVIYGGKSPEHEVSIITAVQAMASMPKEYETIPLYVSKSGQIFTGDHLKSISSYQNMPLLEKMAEHVALPSSPQNISLTPANPTIFKKSTKPFDVILLPRWGRGGRLDPGTRRVYGVPIVGTA
jgi:D-alanine-D-alanine ligase